MIGNLKLKLNNVLFSTSISCSVVKTKTKKKFQKLKTECVKFHFNFLSSCFLKYQTLFQDCQRLRYTVHFWSDPIYFIPFIIQEKLRYYKKSRIDHLLGVDLPSLNKF